MRVIGRRWILAAKIQDGTGSAGHSGSDPAQCVSLLDGAEVWEFLLLHVAWVRLRALARNPPSIPIHQFTALATS